MTDNTSRRPAILSEAGAHSEWVARPLLEAGFTLDTCSMIEVPERLATGKYNVLVLGTLYCLRRTLQQQQADFAALNKAIADFVARGGGVYFIWPQGGVGDYQELFRPWGAGFIHVRMHDEPGTANEDGMAFGYTTEVSNPVADGVKGVWYVPTFSHTGTRPVDVCEEDGWQVVLRGTAKSHTVPWPGDLTPPPMINERVPLMAIRDVKPGRLAIFGQPSGFTFSSPYNFPAAHQVLSEGIEGTPSDMLRLQMNLLSWLAAPSLEAGTLGGAETNPQVFEPNVPRYPDDPPVKWAERTFPDDCTPLRGLVGARTAYSTGSGTVAEYIAGARDAGLDYLVFLEDFKALDAEKLQALKDDCRAHTSETFFAVPGYTIEDITGNHFFIFGYQVAMPKPDLLSDDGKVLAHKGPEGPPRAKRLDAVHCSFMFEEMHLRGRRGTYRHAENPMRIVDLRFCDTIALVTWEDGQVTEDVRDQYRMMEDMGFLLAPTVLTFMNSPEDVPRAIASGWRNEIIEPYAGLEDRVLIRNMAPELDWWGFADESLWSTPYRRFDNWQYSWPYQYITSGPEIRSWVVSASGRDDIWRGPDSDIPPTADWFRADVVGFRLRIHAVSECGIADVLLYDGERLLRRWDARGAKDFQQELDLVNHQQFNLQLEVRDVRGGVATAQDYHTHRLDWCEFFCADRNNRLSIGFEKDQDGTAFGWGGTIYLTYNMSGWGGTAPVIGRWWYYGDYLSPVPHDPLNDNICPADGGVKQPGCGLHVFVKMPPTLDPPEYGLVNFPLREMISSDVAIGGMYVRDGFDYNWPYFFGQEVTGWSFFPVHPTRYLWLRRRGIAFRPRARALTTMLYNWDLRFKQDPKLTEPLWIGWLEPQGTHVFHRRDGATVTLAGLDTEGEVNIRWRKGEYLVSWLDGRRPAIFINDGADVEIVRDKVRTQVEPTSFRSGMLTLRLPVDCLPTTERTTRVQFIGIGGNYEHTDPNIGETVRQVMGLTGEPAYRITMESGIVLSRELFLRLDGREGVACHIPQSDLPMALPVLVEGMNENWPVFLVDRATNRWRPLGVLEGIAYATVDTLEQDWTLFIGHPVTASSPEVVISLAQISPTEWALEAHNPTKGALTITLTPSPYIDLLDWQGETVTLEAGTSLFRTIEAKALAPA
ncbi:MAG: hypothetical protein ACYC7E_04235 [Armatimonadota bacterium]